MEGVIRNNLQKIDKLALLLRTNKEQDIVSMSTM
jgi:hypothetical protein